MAAIDATTVRRLSQTGGPDRADTVVALRGLIDEAQRRKHLEACTSYREYIDGRIAALRSTLWAYQSPVIESAQVMRRTADLAFFSSVFYASEGKGFEQPCRSLGLVDGAVAGLCVLATGRYDADVVDRARDGLISGQIACAAHLIAFISRV